MLDAALLQAMRKLLRSGSGTTSREGPLSRAGASGLESIFQFLNARSPRGAQNVLRAIHDAISEIVAHPKAAPLTSDPSLHVKILGRYRYRIFYAVDGDIIDIIHFRHGARRPWIGQ